MDEDYWLGSVFSDLPRHRRHLFAPDRGRRGIRRSAGPRSRLVREDVADDYVSLSARAKDYGVVLH